MEQDERAVSRGKVKAIKRDEELIEAEITEPVLSAQPEVRPVRERHRQVSVRSMLPVSPFAVLLRAPNDSSSLVEAEGFIQNRLRELSGASESDEAQAEEAMLLQVEQWLNSGTEEE